MLSTFSFINVLANKILLQALNLFSNIRFTKLQTRPIWELKG
uniref:Uncharacterized protein n=1 Tax=Populus trichocarpa TaxID=3694 RepID=A0A3N7FE75_POPTR